jgi:predicted O-methyltransferase YrrM
VIAERARRLNFDMACDARTGALLRTLAAAHPNGRILELGTGVGTSTAWLLAGMGAAATLVTVDNTAAWIDIARHMLGGDPRVTFVEEDGGVFLESVRGQSLATGWADDPVSWPGRRHLPSNEELTLCIHAQKP